MKSRLSKPVLLVKLALHLYERSLCSCGHSAFLAHGYEGVGEYDADTVNCHACGAIARVKLNGPGQKAYALDLHGTPHDPVEPDEDEDGDLE